MKKLVFVLLAFLGSNGVYSQQDSTAGSVGDTALYTLIKGLVQKEVSSVKSKYQERNVLARQAVLFGQLRRYYGEAGAYMRSGIDTSGILKDLKEISQKTAIAGDGIFQNKGSIQTARNLSVSSILFRELLANLEKRQLEIDKHYKALGVFRNRIDSLAMDSALFYVPRDSVLMMDFMQKLMLISSENSATDSAIDNELKTLRDLQNVAAMHQLILKTDIAEIDAFRTELAGKTFSKELAPIWGATGYTRPFKEILHFSKEKNISVMLFYLNNHLGKLVLLVLLILAFGAYFAVLKRNILQAMGGLQLNKDQLALQHPKMTAIFLGFTIWQFIMPNPPFGVYALFWTITTIALTIIFRKYISQYWLRFWYISLALFFAALWLNSVLQASRVERYFMLILSVAGIVMGLKYIFNKHKEALIEKRLQWLLWIFTAFQVAATIGNLIGTYNFSKALLTSGYMALTVGTMLLWLVRILVQVFELSAQAYSNESKYNIDFARLGKEAPGFLYGVVAVGWLVLIAHNFYIYQKLTDPVKELFTRQYTIGNTTFSLATALLFIFIILVSALASRIVSFIVSNPATSKVTKERQKGIGSWLLLIRIAISVAGILLAFMATGIPIDKLTIIFGGLSVGIGFGLQAIFESMISGIIIAFEKPINVGDEIQIAGVSGIMKSIGFRSSIIATFDGSDVTIPNNELLKSQLVNWTLSNSNRRVEILVGVDYKTDLVRTSQLLKELMVNDNRILKNPGPGVLVKEFGGSSIDLRLLFWVNNLNNWPVVKSELMMKIKTLFDSEGIEIPFPQMVLHNTEEEEITEQTVNPDSEQEPGTNVATDANAPRLE